MNRLRLMHAFIAIALILIGSAVAQNAQAGWPLGQPSRSRHVAPNYHGYYVMPTYEYMPRAYPYGNFGARGYTPSTVHYDHNYQLRTWGPGFGH